MYEQAQFTTLSIIMHFLMESTFSIFWKPVSCHNRLDAPVTSSFCHAVVPFLKSLKNASLDSRFFVSVFAHYLVFVFLERCCLYLQFTWPLYFLKVVCLYLQLTWHLYFLKVLCLYLAFLFLESCVSVFALDLVFVFLERCAQLSSHVIWKMQWSARDGGRFEALSMDPWRRPPLL